MTATSRLNLNASNSVLVDDVDVEIFELYTHKNKCTEPRGGLGMTHTSQAILNISMCLQDPNTGLKMKGKRKEIEIDMNILQNLDSLRNRPGDTNSVVWRASILLAKIILLQHYFPTTQLPLINLSTSTVLELGSGTGALGILLNSIVKNWIFTDLLESLPLILKNVNSNHCTNTEIVELDWLDPHYTPTEPPDFIFSIDGIYNPALSLPLAKTIDLCAGDNTIVLILAELREPEALEIFLEEMRKLKFKIRRVIFDESDELNGQFVLWIASKLELIFVN